MHLPCIPQWLTISQNLLPHLACRGSSIYDIHQHAVSTFRSQLNKSSMKKNCHKTPPFLPTLVAYWDHEKKWVKWKSYPPKTPTPDGTTFSITRIRVRISSDMSRVSHKVRIIFREKVSVSISLLLLIWYGGNIFGFTKTDVTSVILSHECATLSRDKLADAATVRLHAATLSRNQTRLLHHFSRFTILLHKHSSKMAKFFNI